MPISHRETRAVGLGMCIIASFTFLVLTSGRVDLGDFAQMWISYTSGAFALTFLLGMAALVWVFGRNALTGKTDEAPLAFVKRIAQERWERDRFLSLVWPPLLFSSLMASFNAYKQMILITAGFRFDNAFAAMDRALFFGHDPWTITHAIFASPQLTLLIDRLYHGWFVPMAFGVIICAWLPANSYRLRTQYMLSYIAIWIGIGSILSYMMPAAGPCFVPALIDSSSSFNDLLTTLKSQQAALGSDTIVALQNQELLLRLKDSAELAPGGGISAMPSVHNALAVLFALAAFRIHRFAGYAMTAYALLIWIGSIHLGWHYAVDGLAAAAITLAIWRGTGHVVDWLERPMGFVLKGRTALSPSL
jgi:PAP2 superfamily